MEEWGGSSTPLWATTNVTIVTINSTPATDVLVSGCFTNFNTIACLRGSLLSFLAVLTGVLCVLKVIKLHRAQHQNWHQYFIFYCASLECAIAAVHFTLNMYVQMDFALQWLKLAQFLVMCHFYWVLATRALRREMWSKRFLIPFLAVACLYFTTVATLGIVEITNTFSECFQPYWLMMSSAEFLIVQLFCVAGFYITRRLNEISTLDSLRRAQKRDLWCIVIVFEISALIGMLYDLVLRVIRNQAEGCSAIFNHGQTLFTIIFFFFMVAKLLAPIWVMLLVFQPTPQVIVENDDLVPALTDDGNSAFSGSDEQYRQLYHPTENYRTLTYDTPTSRSPVSHYTPASPVGSVNTVVNGTPGTQSRPGVTHLTSIREELHSKSSSPHSQGRSGKSVGIVNPMLHQSQPRESVGGVVNKGLIDDEGFVKNGSTSNAVAGNQANQLNQPIRNGDKAQPLIETQGGGAIVEGNPSNVAIASENRGDGPRFTIESADEDSDSSPPKAKFLI
ncbi:uncharacterized protein LOC128237194 [Mya arenaria]|uniref:uncharacterized protein LOC128237194 n=1 Tax=Mya arenaria TaxID=6604 RepID=UPI0022E4F9EF|nr:uncharacterized protein LOC128237194 [Mya arenaria]XP_052808464.1 uncharacterized protein LOC128237194 [Mya arenaria]